MAANTPASAFYLQYDLENSFTSYSINQYSVGNVVGALLGQATTLPQNQTSTALIPFSFSDSNSGFDGKSIEITASVSPLTLGVFIINGQTTIADGKNFGPTSVPEAPIAIIETSDLTGGITGIDKISLVYFASGAKLTTNSSFILSNELLTPGTVKQIVGFDLNEEGTSFTRTAKGSVVNGYAILAGLGSKEVEKSDVPLEAIGALIGNTSSIDFTAAGDVVSFSGLVVPTGSVNMTAYGVKVNGGDFKAASSKTTISAAVYADSTFSTEGGGTYAAYGLYVENPPLEPELNAVENPPELVLDGVSFSAVRGTTNLSAENTTGSAIYVGTGGNVTLTGTTKVNQDVAYALTQAGYNFSDATNVVVPLDAINVVNGGVLNIGEGSTNATITYNGDILVDGGSLVFSNEAKSSLTPGSIGGDAVTNNLIFQNVATLSQGTGANAGSIEAQNIEVYGVGNGGAPFTFSGPTKATGALIIGPSENSTPGTKTAPASVEITNTFDLSNASELPSSISEGSTLNVTGESGAFTNNTKSQVDVYGTLSVSGASASLANKGTINVYGAEDSLVVGPEVTKFDNSEGEINVMPGAEAQMGADFSGATATNKLGSFNTAGNTTFSNSAGLALLGSEQGASTLNVTGGTTTVTGAITVSEAGDYPSLNVTGGTLEANGKITNSGGSISVGQTAGTINANGGLANTTGTTSVLSGGTLNVPETLSTGGKLDVTGGLVNATGGMQSSGTTSVTEGGKIIVSGGEDTNAGLTVSEGTFDVNGGTVEVSDAFNMTGGAVTVKGSSQTQQGTLDLSGITDPENFTISSGSLGIQANGTLKTNSSNLVTEGEDGAITLQDGIGGTITFAPDSSLNFTDSEYTLDWLNDFTEAASKTGGIKGSTGSGSLQFTPSGSAPSLVMTGDLVDSKGNVQDSVTMEDLKNLGKGTVLGGVTLKTEDTNKDGSFNVGGPKADLSKSLGFGNLDLGAMDQLNVLGNQSLTLTGKEGEGLVESTTGPVETNIGSGTSPVSTGTLNFGTSSASESGKYDGNIHVNNGDFNVTGPAGEEENPSYDVNGGVTLGTAGSNNRPLNGTSGNLNVTDADLAVKGNIDVLGAGNPGSSIDVNGGALTAGSLTGAQPAEGQKPFTAGQLLTVTVEDGSANFSSVGTEEAPLQGASFGITDGSFASSGDINLGPVTAGGDKPTIELDNGSFTAEGNMTLSNGHSIEMDNSEFSARGNMNLSGTNVTLGGDVTGQNNTFSAGGNATLSGVTIQPPDDPDNPGSFLPTPSTDFHFGSLTTEPLTQGSGAATNTSIVVPQGGSFVVDGQANIGEGSTLVLGGSMGGEETPNGFISNAEGNGVNASFGELNVTGSTVAVGGPTVGSPTTKSSSLAIGSLDLSTPEVAEGEDQPSNGGLIIGSGVRASVGAGTGQEAVDAAIGRAQSALNAFAGRPNVPNINSDNIIDTPASSFAYFAGSNTIGESNGLLVNAGEGAALTPGNVTIGNGNTSTVLAVDGVPGQSTFVGSEDASFTLGSEGATNTQVVVFAHGNGTGYIATGFDPENITNYLAENPKSIIGPYMYNVAWDTENDNPTAFTMQLDPAKVDAIGSVIPNSTKAAGDLFGIEGGEYILSILDGIDGSPASIAQARGLLNQLALRGAAAHAHEIGINVSSMVMDSVTNHGTHLSGYGHEAGMGDMWIDLNWNHSKADFTAGGLSNGYKMDLYGATMGADYFVGNGFSVGAAVSVGGGETKAKGTDSGQKTNTTYWGVNLYGVYDAASFNVIGHVGFMQALNKSKYAGIKARPDTNIWTVGVRAEKDFAVTDKICITPHVGVRYLNVDVDSVNAQGFHYEFKKANLVQFPFGVTATGIAKLDSGAEVKPFIDLQITPTAGKKKLENSFSIMGSEAKDVINSTVATTMLYQAKVGINAVNGAHSFGLNFGIGAGKDSRLDTALQAKYRFTF